MGTLEEDQNIFMIIYCSVLIRMKNVTDKNCREKSKHTFCVQYRFFENRTVYEIMWKNIGEPDSLQMIIWRMRIACWIPKATNTHSENVIFIAFPLQQRLQECALMLRYTYIGCLVYLLVLKNYYIYFISAKLSMDSVKVILVSCNLKVSHISRVGV